MITIFKFIGPYFHQQQIYFFYSKNTFQYSNYFFLQYNTLFYSKVLFCPGNFSNNFEIAIFEFYALKTPTIHNLTKIEQLYLRLFNFSRVQ